VTIYLEGKDKAVPVLKQLSTTLLKWMGEWRYTSNSIDFGTRWRWKVCLTPLPLYPRGKSPRYPLDGRLSRPKSVFGRCGEENNTCTAVNRTRTVQALARRYTDRAIPSPEYCGNDIKHEHKNVETQVVQ
jgi:hypothetical protein